MELIATQNLFVVHTQYNLLLAIGIAKAKESVNDLILFQDFNLSDILKAKFESIFQHVLILPGNYPKQELAAWQKYKKIKNDIQQIQSFIQTMYHEVFIVDDVCAQEMFAMKCAYQHNPSCKFNWLEDGGNAYFHNGAVSGGLGSTPVRRFIRKHLLSSLFHLHGFYDLGRCFGDHKRLTSIYVTFQDYVRPELQTKPKVEITRQQFMDGMTLMYGGKPYPMEENSVLFAMDKLSVYGDKLESINRIILDEVAACQSEGRKIYCKYHPRETDALPALANATEVDSKIAMEYYLVNTTAKRMTIIGVKSTALQTALKMGFQVISLALTAGETDENILNFYKNIGILLK